MNRYSEFFRFDAHAHLTSAISGTYRLYDRRDDVRSLRTLVEAARSAPGVSTAEIEAAVATLEAAEPIAGGLAKLRNKAFGHTDLERTYDQVFEVAQTTPFQLRSLLEDALAIVNRFETVLGEVPTEFHELPLEDLHRLLSDLEDFHKLGPGG